MTDQQTSRTNITEALRAEFQRRGWSITMSDNGQSVLDPFPVVAALAAEPSEPTAFGPRPSRGFTLDEEHYFDVWPPRSDALTAHAAYHREEPCDCEPQPDEPSTEAGRRLLDDPDEGYPIDPDSDNDLARGWRLSLAQMIVAIEREARAASASVPPLDVLRADVAAIVSGYPMQDGKPLGIGGRAFEQCREAVLRLIDRSSPGLDVDRLARAIEAEDDRLPFLDSGIDSTTTPRAVAEQIAVAYAAETPERGSSQRSDRKNLSTYQAETPEQGRGDE